MSGIKRAAIYARVSSERQAEKASIPSQLEDARAYCRDRNYLLTGEYIDAEKYRIRGRQVEPSGTRTDRPAFVRMLTDARAGRFDVVVAWREDRLYRSLKAASLIDDLLEDTKVNVELVRENFDRSMLGFKAAMGRFELNAIKERTEMGRLGRVREGRPANKVPLVYNTLRGADGKVTGYVFNETHREWFTELARLFLAHESYYLISRRLERHPVTGMRLAPEAVRRMIADPFYRGLIAYGLRGSGYHSAEFVVPGLHKAVWDETTCQAIVDEIERRGHVNRAAPRGSDGIFIGVLRCGHCGRCLNASVRMTKKRGPVRWYRCRQPDLAKYGFVEGKGHPPNNINEATVLNLLKTRLATLDETGVGAFVNSLALTIQPVQDNAWVKARIDILKSEAKDLRADLKKVKGKASFGILEADLTRVETQISELQVEVAAPAGAPVDGAQLKARMLQLRGALQENLPPKELREIISDIFPALFVKDGRLVANQERGV